MHPGMEQPPPLPSPSIYQTAQTSHTPIQEWNNPPLQLSKTAHPAPQNSHPPIQEWNNPPLQSIKNCPPSPSKQPSTHPGMEQSTPPIYLKLPTQPLKTAIHPSRNGTIHPSCYQKLPTQPLKTAIHPSRNGTIHPSNLSKTAHPAPQNSHPPIQEWSTPFIHLPNDPSSHSTSQPADLPSIHPGMTQSTHLPIKLPTWSLNHPSTKQPMNPAIYQSAHSFAYINHTTSDCVWMLLTLCQPSCWCWASSQSLHSPAPWNHSLRTATRWCWSLGRRRARARCCAW